ncbi:MAG: hypothetical protein PHE08_10990, partial [Bacteroidales bacterium]|nr:hypothetical protein [Bacteroidales bacterium]
MKQKIILFLGICLFSFNLVAQSVNSWEGLNNGNQLIYNSHVRVLNVFINVIYDVHPDTNIYSNVSYWTPVNDTLLEGVNIPTTLPNYLLNFMDTAYVIGNPNACITCVFGESSFDTLQVIGDFVVVNVRESRVIADPTSVAFRCQTASRFCYNKVTKVAIDIINNSGGLNTLYGHDSISDYISNGYSFSNVLIRN